MPNICNDYGGNPKCQRDADPAYTMDFTDIKPEGYVYWCQACGPDAHRMMALITERCAEDPEFRDRMRAAVDEAKATLEKH